MIIMPDYSSALYLRKAQAMIGGDYNSSGARSTDQSVKKRLKFMGTQKNLSGNGGGNGNGNGGGGGGGGGGVSSTAQPPTNVTVGNITTTSFRVNWSAPASSSYTLTSYRVIYGTNSNINLNFNSSLYTTSSATFIDVAAASGTTYYVWVGAVYDGGTSEVYSTRASVTTASPGTPAPTPNGFQKNGVTSSEIRLSWIAPSIVSGYTLFGYKVYYNTANNFNAASGIIIDNGTLSTNGILGGLTANTTYYLWITALYNYSGANESAPIRITGNTVKTLISVPAPRNFTKTSTTQNTIQVSWDAPTSSSYAVTGYNVQFNQQGEPTRTIIPVPSTDRTAYITDLIPGNTYSIWISAVYGNDGYESSSVQLSPSPTTNSGSIIAVTPIADLNCVTQPPPSLRQLKISWSNYNPSINAGYEFAFYRFFISTTDTRPYDPVDGDIVKSSTTFTFDRADNVGTPLLNGTSYYLWVQTVWRNTTTSELFFSFTGTPSTPKYTIGTTLAGPPPPRFPSAFNIGSTSVDFSWTPPEFSPDPTSGFTDSDFRYYNIYASESSTLTVSDQITTTNDPNFKLITSSYLTILPTTSYYIGVSATFQSGESNIVMLTPSPTTTISTKTVDHITSLATQQVGVDHIKVQWDDYSATTGTGTFKFSFYISTTPTIPASTTLNSNTKTITEYDFTSLDSNTTYYIWVVASFGTNDSEPVALSAKTLAQV